MSKVIEKIMSHNTAEINKDIENIQNEIFKLDKQIESNIKNKKLDSIEFVKKKDKLQQILNYYRYHLDTKELK